MDKEFSIPFFDDNAIASLCDILTKKLYLKYRYSDIVILCIGTDRSTGDALGPLTGSKLRQFTTLPLHIYGNLEEPVHAINLQETIDHINRNHANACVIAVDACLGRLKNVGMINIIHGPLKPGAGVNKNLPEVGDIHITGIVNVGGFMEYFVLQNTRLNLVMKMADVISSSIYLSMQQFLTLCQHTQIKGYDSKIIRW